MKEKNFYMIAKTMYGLENILANELKKIGAQNVKVLNRAVKFQGDKGFMYKANLNLRTALRILKPIAYFQAHNENELYKNVCKIDWTKLFNLNCSFATNATTNSEVFQHSKYASLILKDGIVDVFRKKYNKRPYVDPKDPDISVNLHIDKHTCTISLDSSGISLHKRGYKKRNVIAPINEVLAAGLILLSDWNKKSNFHDPMCGSGTILIEAAMIANNIPANIFRKKFSFQKWKDFEPLLWEKIKDNSLNKEIQYLGKITGCDDNEETIKIAKFNIENSLLSENIFIKKTDFFKNKIEQNTFVIFNPPYGIRINKNIDDFYIKIGDTLKNKYKNCTVWIISSDIEKIKYVGLKPSKKIKLLNGQLECSFRKYEIYEGSKKRKLI